MMLSLKKAEDTFTYKISLRNESIWPPSEKQLSNPMLNATEINYRDVVTNKDGPYKVEFKNTLLPRKNAELIKQFL
jgi:hypothetical protein